MPPKASNVAQKAVSSQIAPTTSSSTKTNVDALQPSSNDVSIMRDRMAYIFATLIGFKVRLTTASASVYEGILHTASAESNCGVVLRMAHHLGESNSIAPIHYIPELLFEWKDVAWISAKHVRSDDFQAHIGFQTDLQVTGSHGEMRERELVPFMMDDAESPKILDSFDLRSGHGQTTAWDQYSVNARFGIQSTYNEDIYTTSIDRSAPDYLEREKRADQLAREIESGFRANPTTNPVLRDERGLEVDASIDEDFLYGSAHPMSASASGSTATTRQGAKGKTEPSKTQSDVKAQKTSSSSSNRPRVDGEKASTPARSTEIKIEDKSDTRSGVSASKPQAEATKPSGGESIWAARSFAQVVRSTEAANQASAAKTPAKSSPTTASAVANTSQKADPSSSSKPTSEQKQETKSGTKSDQKSDQKFDQKSESGSKQKPSVDGGKTSEPNVTKETPTPSSSDGKTATKIGLKSYVQAASEAVAASQSGQSSTKESTSTGTTQSPASKQAETKNSETKSTAPSDNTSVLTATTQEPPKETNISNQHLPSAQNPKDGAQETQKTDGKTPNPSATPHSESLQKQDSQPVATEIAKDSGDGQPTIQSTPADAAAADEKKQEKKDGIAEPPQFKSTLNIHAAEYTPSSKRTPGSTPKPTTPGQRDSQQYGQGPYKGKVGRKPNYNGGYAAPHQQYPGHVHPGYAAVQYPYGYEDPSMYSMMPQGGGAPIMYPAVAAMGYYPGAYQPMAPAIDPSGRSYGAPAYQGYNVPPSSRYPGHYPAEVGQQAGGRPSMNGNAQYGNHPGSRGGSHHHATAQYDPNYAHYEDHNAANEQGDDSAN